MLYQLSLNDTYSYLGKKPTMFHRLNTVIPSLLIWHSIVFPILGMEETEALDKLRNWYHEEEVEPGFNPRFL